MTRSTGIIVHHLSGTRCFGFSQRTKIYSSDVGFSTEARATFYVEINERSEIGREQMGEAKLVVGGLIKICTSHFCCIWFGVCDFRAH